MKQKKKINDEAKAIRLLAFLLLLTVALPLLSSCSRTEEQYTLSLGTVITQDGIGESCTSAAVVTDKDGRIALCRIDCAELSTTSEGGKVASVTLDKTKFELGNDYGMKEKGNAKAEWYAEAKFFEDYAVGKTADEIRNVKTGDADLAAGCTIDVSDFTAAVVKAMESRVKVSFTSSGKMKAGLAIGGSVSDNGGNAEFIHDIAAVVTAGEVIVAATADSAEATVKVVDDKADSLIYSGTKNELGDEYGMVEKGKAQWEWYEQAQSFADTAMGKKPSDLSSLPVENVAGCTINPSPLKVALIRAKDNAR